MEWILQSHLPVIKRTYVQAIKYLIFSDTIAMRRIMHASQ